MTPLHALCWSLSARISRRTMKHQNAIFFFAFAREVYVCFFPNWHRHFSLCLFFFIFAFSTSPRFWYVSFVSCNIKNSLCLIDQSWEETRFAASFFVNLPFFDSTMGPFFIISKQNRQWRRVGWSRCEGRLLKCGFYCWSMECGRGRIM